MDYIFFYLREYFGYKSISLYEECCFDFCDVCMGLRCVFLVKIGFWQIYQVQVRVIGNILFIVLFFFDLLRRCDELMMKCLNLWEYQEVYRLVNEKFCQSFSSFLLVVCFVWGLIYVVMENIVFIEGDVLVVKV